jgi:hypothetical protein
MTKEIIISVIKKDPKIKAHELVYKIYQALNPEKSKEIVKAVQFPKGTASDHLEIKLDKNTKIDIIKSKLKNISEITLK